MPDQVPPAVAKSFSALIPGAVIILLWLIIYIALDNLPFGNIHDLIVNTLGVPLSLMGGTLIGTIILVGLNSAFWFVGIHGANVVNAVMQPIWLKNIDENRIAYQANPHGEHEPPSSYSSSSPPSSLYNPLIPKSIDHTLRLRYLKYKRKRKCLVRLTRNPAGFD